jgi:hypothetical protein
VPRDAVVSPTLSNPFSADKNLGDPLTATEITDQREPT